MYGKIFDSMYDGTLADDWRALITFQQMIVLCDADGVIDMTPAAISRRTGIPVEHIKAGIDVLENPDPYSRTPDEEGRRIQRMDDTKPWGWYIVNHNKYKALQDSDTVREQNRLRKQKQRNKSKESRMVTDGHTPSRHTDTDTDTYTDINNSSCPDKKADIELAETMYNLILVINENHKKPNLEKWADTIRLIRDRDGKSRQEIEELFRWANNDSFWKTNILSPEKLRKQWDSLTIRRREGNGSNQRPYKQSGQQNAREVAKEALTRSMGGSVYAQDAGDVPREVLGEVVSSQ